jgi:ParB family transcriptional regulator, chromosome partitioning protein
MHPLLQTFLTATLPTFYPMPNLKSLYLKERPMPDKTIVSIPLQKIMPNPHQPRRSFREGSIQEMADSLKAIGQETPIKVRPLTPEELKLYAPYEFMVVGGHRRRAGAELAGLEALDCIVLNITPQQARRKALMDNNQDEMDWWDWDLAIYDLLQDPPKPTQVELAKQIGKSRAKVYNALKIVTALTPTSLEIIDRNLGKISPSEGVKCQPLASKNKGFLITESILLALADLEDPQQVEKALKVVIDGYLEEPQVKRLVAGVKGGQQLEDYSPEKVSKAFNHQDTKAPRTAKSTENGMVKQPIQTPTLAPAGTPTDPHASFKLVGHALGSAFHWIWHNPLPLLKSLAGWGKHQAIQSLEKTFQQTLQREARRLVKTALLFVVLGLVGLFFFHGTLTHVIAWLMNVQPPGMQTGLNHQAPRTAPSGSDQGPSTAQSQESGDKALSGTGVASRAGGQPQVGQPSAEAEATSANDSQKIKPLTRVEKNAQAALVFARHYFGANYQDIDSWKDFFKQAIDNEDYDPFMDDHFPYKKIHEITGKKLVMSFKPTQPVKLLDSDDSSDTFLVNGVMTTRTNKDDLSVLVSKKPVAAQIVFNLQSAGRYKVGYVKDLTHDEAQELLDSSPRADASDSTQMANSPSELAQPNRGSQQEASTQVADSPAASSKVDPLAKAVGDAAGEAAKKALGPQF